MAIRCTCGGSVSQTKATRIGRRVTEHYVCTECHRFGGYAYGGAGGQTTWGCVERVAPEQEVVV